MRDNVFESKTENRLMNESNSFIDCGINYLYKIVDFLAASVPTEYEQPVQSCREIRAKTVQSTYYIGRISRART